MVNHNKSVGRFEKVSWVNVGEQQQGQRLDNFLLRYLKGVPKSRIYRIVRKGEVRVNKGRVKAEYKLQKGDQIRIPPIRTAHVTPGDISIPDWVKLAITQPLFEDEALLVINKPPRLAVHGGTGIQFGLIEAARQLYPQTPFLELVHRIDRETSGCIVLAKARNVLNALHEQFRRQAGRVEKSYLSILYGQLYEVKKIRSALRQTRDDKGMKQVVVDSAGQSAKSTIMPIETYQDACYARIGLLTGRMHQARVHAASIGHPILGDKLYGNWEANRWLKSFGGNRCLLHAERYQFNHPLTGKQIQLIAPLPEDFKLVQEKLKNNA